MALYLFGFGEITTGPTPTLDPKPIFFFGQPLGTVTKRNSNLEPRIHRAGGVTVGTKLHYFWHKIDRAGSLEERTFSHQAWRHHLTRCSTRSQISLGQAKLTLYWLSLRSPTGGLLSLFRGDNSLETFISLEHWNTFWDKLGSNQRYYIHSFTGTWALWRIIWRELSLQRASVLYFFTRTPTGPWSGPMLYNLEIMGQGVILLSEVPSALVHFSELIHIMINLPFLLINYDSTIFLFFLFFFSHCGKFYLNCTFRWIR